MMKHLPLYLFALLMTFWAHACSEKIEPGTATESRSVIKDVSVATARMTEEPVIYEAVGTVKAGIRSTLGSKLLGTVEEVRVREGDLVEKGDTLVLIDQRQVDAEARKARASLSEAKKALAAATSAREAARAAERLALSTYERYHALKNKNMVSIQEYEQKEAQLARAKSGFEEAEATVDAGTARVKQAEAALTAAQVARKDAVITAPHDGIITAKLVDKGDLANPGTPLLNLETTHGFCVDVVVPETYIDHVESRQRVFVKVPALKSDPFEGNVCTIVPSADPRSRSFIVKVTLPIDRIVRSGLFARVQIPIGHGRKLLIPTKAVLSRGQLTGLYLVDPDNTVHFRLIRLGKTLEDAVEVLSGLREGDRYVVEPMPTLTDGAKVEVTP